MKSWELCASLSNAASLVEQTELTPVENGIEMVLDNLNQLRTVISRIRGNPTQSTSPLTMKLNGTLDAAVNGGVSKFEVLPSEEILLLIQLSFYCSCSSRHTHCISHHFIAAVLHDIPTISLIILMQVFFTTEYQEQNPKCVHFVPRLKMLMEELVQYIPVISLCHLQYRAEMYIHLNSQMLCV